MLEVPAVAALTILVLAFFVGLEVISKVPLETGAPALSRSTPCRGISMGMARAIGATRSMARENTAERFMDITHWSWTHHKSEFRAKAQRWTPRSGPQT